MKNNCYDTDFIGVSYRGEHLLHEYGLYRVSNSNRYDTNIAVNMKLNSATVKNYEGGYYFNSFKEPQLFNLNFAFDKLSSVQLKKLIELLSPKEMGELIFDEYPYKVYDVKVQQPPKLEYVLFDGENKTTDRIYKGTLSVTFVCYDVFAHTPKDIKNEHDGRYLRYYNLEECYKPEQWLDVSGLIKLDETPQLGLNRGEIPAPFVVTLTGAVHKGDYVSVAGNKVTFLEECTNVEWNSKTGLIVGTVGDTKRAIRFTGQSICRLPVTDENTDFNKIFDCKYSGDPEGESTLFNIDYQFWYY